MEKSFDKVRPKKSLGQHFLHDQNTARKIVESLKIKDGANPVLEIGPGMGVLTQYLVTNDKLNLKLIEIDRDSVKYLHKHYASMGQNIIEGDFFADGVEERVW